MAKKFLIFVELHIAQMAKTPCRPLMPSTCAGCGADHCRRPRSACTHVCAMTDVSALTGDDTYNHALEAIWTNIVDAKMHITGGLGAIHASKVLAKITIYQISMPTTTCAAIGNLFFSHRMTLLHKDAKYFDVAEVSLNIHSLVSTWRVINSSMSIRWRRMATSCLIMDQRVVRRGSTVRAPIEYCTSYKSRGRLHVCGRGRHSVCFALLW